jgi:hypothetical protein
VEQVTPKARLLKHAASVDQRALQLQSLFWHGMSPYKAWQNSRKAQVWCIEEISKYASEKKQQLEGSEYDVRLCAAKAASMKANGWKTAMKHLKVALEISPIFPDAYYSLATVLQLESKYSAAAAALQHGLERIACRKKR